MEKVNLDCKGLACPQPVLNCKQAIDQQRPKLLEVTVDNPAAAENVTRFLTNNNYQVTREQTAGAIVLLARDSAENTPASCPECEDIIQEASSHPARNLVLITTQYLGQGDDQLGKKLMKNFIATLPEMGKDLWRIILLNSGVKLATANSPVISELQELSQKGVSILVCGTCLDHFDLLEEKQVGETTNMLDVVTSLQLASKIIKI